MARNIEVLRNYFLGKDPQLKETMADNSLRLIGIPGRHFVLRTELIQRIKELKDYVDEQDQGLQDAIDTLADTLENEIDRLENKYNITEDTRLYELANGVYRVITPEIRLYYNQNGSMINDDDLILIKEAKSYFIFSTVPSTDHPAMTYGIADASDGWKATLMFEEIEQTTNKKDTITQSSTDYPSGLAVFNALSNYYTKGQVDALISLIPQFDIEVVQTLPVQDISDTTIYLVPSQDPQTANSYDEFIHVNNAWEQIGSTAIDLSNYYTKTETDNLLDNKQDVLTAGDNISIVNNAISTIGYGITKLENGTKIWDLDTGIYEADSTISIYYDAAGTSSHPFVGVLFVYNNTAISKKYWYSFGDGESLSYGNVTASTYFNGGMGISFNYQNKNDKVTSISSSSTDIQYPSARAVYNSLPTDFTGTDGNTDGTNGLVPAPTTTDTDKYLKSDGTWSTVQAGTTITYGTTELTPGVSPLAEGTFYFQYE